ncbi:MAG: CHASE2 domain-containing protein [Pseudomonadota bacterium]
MSVSLAVFVYLFNPFGLLDETQDLSQRLSQRGYALLFDKGYENQNITSVIIDSVTVDSLGSDTGYPVNMDVHATLLRTILCGGPSSIYIDIAFQNARPDLRSQQTESEAVERLRRALATRAGDAYCQQFDAQKQPVDTEIFLARVIPQKGDCAAFSMDTTVPTSPKCQRFRPLDALQSVVTPISISRVQPTVQHVRYPLFATATNAFRFQDDDAASARRRMPKVEKSPATAMMLAFCKNQSPNDVERTLCEKLSADEPDDVLSDLSDTLNLVPLWRYYLDERQLWQRFQSQSLLSAIQEQSAQSSGSPTPSQQSVLRPASAPSDAENRCRFPQKVVQDGSAWFLTASNFGVALLDELFGGPKNISWAGFVPRFGEGTCLPYPYLPGSVVSELRNACAAPNGCGNALQKAFGGKAIVYGYDIDAANDNFQSPVLGRLPGMIVHAAALDNLMRFGTDYKKEAVDVGSFQLDANKLNLILVFVLGTIGVLRSWSWFTTSQAAVFQVSAVGAAVLLPATIGLPPFDWIGSSVLGLLTGSFWKSGHLNMRQIEMEKVETS